MYFTPYIDGNGVHIPTYEDRLDALLSSYRSIFGPEANLEISSPDYQLLSVLARALDDLSQIILVDFASRNPLYASGVGLDLLLPLMGLTRGGATYSTVPLRLTGTPLAVLPAAPRVLDDAGYIWACRTAGIQLNAEGTALVTAVCETPGAVSAPAGSVRRLVSPVSGLSSAVNPQPAVPGTEAETDASCRARYFAAASAPSVGQLEAVRAAVASVPNVAACAVYENDTDETDARGIPPHSVCAVISGGNAVTVAQKLFEKKAPGVGTYGNIPVTVQDAWGVSHTVHVKRAVSSSVALTVELQPLSGWDASIPERIRSALADYGSTLSIGQDLVVSSLYPVVYSAAGTSVPPFSVSLLSASFEGSSTTGVLAAAWDQRYALPPVMIQIIVAGE